MAQSPFAGPMDTQLYDTNTGQTYDPSKVLPVPGQPPLPTGIQTATPTNPQQSPFAGAAATITGDQINADYEKYLGRDPGHFANGQVDPGEAGSYVWDAWKTMTPEAAAAAIAASPEAQQFAKTGQGANAQLPGTGGFTNPVNRPSGSAGLANPEASAFFKTLQGRIGAGVNVDPNDPIIKAQTEAYNADSTRAGRDVLTAAAERGGPTANLTAANMSVAENAAQNQAGFAANLMSQERQARRADIQQALSLGASFLSTEQQQQLQAQLDEMNMQERAYEFDTNQAYLESPFAPGAGA